MTKEYAKGIFIKKFEGKFGEWLSVSIKKGDKEYDRYKFYPCREQKNDKYVEFYGVVDTWQPENQKSQKDVIIDEFDGEEVIGNEEIPF